MNEYVISFMDGSQPVVVTADTANAASELIPENDRAWISAVIQIG